MAGTASILGGAPVLHRSRGVVRIECALTTDAAGDVTEFTAGEAWGRIVGVAYDGGLATSGTVTVKDQKTGASLFVLTSTSGTKVYARPSVNIVDNAGAAVTAAATAPNVMRDIKVAGKVNIVVAAGGDTLTGKFALIVDEAGLGTKAVNV